MKIIVVRLADIAQARGYPTASALARQTGISSATCYRWWKDDIKKVSFKHLQTFCMVLKAQPGDLLVYEDLKNSSLQT